MQTGGPSVVKECIRDLDGIFMLSILFLYAADSGGPSVVKESTRDLDAVFMLSSLFLLTDCG
jgi:hypothetical protein